ncbi:MAG: GIY-YIG nuclease family protein [Candidatus Marinimicrobia bacterium]|nr:GIY-YIG nuclease family protein [Candidatus Neomarinimicrobiota bacterium]
MKKKGIFYIIYSKHRDKYYIGSTNDLSRRLSEHNRGHTKSTRIATDWVLKFSREYDTLELARKKERYLKSLKSRKIIERIIANESDLIKKYLGG